MDFDSELGRFVGIAAITLIPLAVFFAVGADARYHYYGQKSAVLMCARASYTHPNDSYDYSYPGPPSIPDWLVAENRSMQSCMHSRGYEFDANLRTCGPEWAMTRVTPDCYIPEHTFEKMLFYVSRFGVFL